MKEPILIGIWGDIKTAKTTLSLSFPKPLIHFDLDQGFHRAEARARIKGWSIRRLAYGEDFNFSGTLADITTKPYLIPITFPGQKAIKGVLELWEGKLIPDIMAAYQSSVASIVLDTETVCWTIASNAHLERIQKSNPNRQQLIQIEYGKPNQEMRALIGAARVYGKNLVLVHHIGGIYKSQLTPQGIQDIRVGDTWAGFGGMGGLVDLVGRTRVERSNLGAITPSFQIETCGLTLAAEGLSIPNPSYGTIMGLVESLRNAGL